MIYSRSKSQIIQEETALERISNQLAMDFFSGLGIKGILLDTGNRRRTESKQIPDLLLKYENIRILCEVKTLQTSGRNKDSEALTHEIEKLMVKLQKGFYYNITFEREANLKKINPNEIIYELKENLSKIDKFPYELIFRNTVRISLDGFCDGSSKLTAFYLPAGVDKTYKNIRNIISRAGSQLSGRFNFPKPKICFIINRRTKEIKSSFRSACLGDSKFSISQNSIVNSGNAALTSGSNRSISTVILLSPEMNIEPIIFSNPHAKYHLPSSLQTKWNSWLINI